MDSMKKITPLETGESQVCDEHAKAKELREVKIGGSVIRSWWICSACEELSSIEQTERQAQIEKERREADLSERTQNRQRLAEVPPRYNNASLGKFIADTPAQVQVLDTLQRFADSFGREPNSLVLCGRLGTGKTYAGYALINHWALADRSSLCVTALGLVRKIRDTWKNDEVRESTVISKLVSTGLLVIDEVGVQSCTDNEHAIIADILNQRYQNLKPTIVIGNLTMAEFSTVLGERAMDRFQEGGRVLAFTWESRRH